MTRRRRASSRARLDRTPLETAEVIIHVPIPVQTYDAYCRASLASRTSIRQIARQILMQSHTTQIAFSVRPDPKR